VSRPAPMKDDPAKAARLAAALRENLRKRKAQARGSDEEPKPTRQSTTRTSAQVARWIAALRSQ
jgi:hypothetical protein